MLHFPGVSEEEFDFEADWLVKSIDDIQKQILFVGQGKNGDLELELNYQNNPEEFENFSVGELVQLPRELFIVAGNHDNVELIRMILEKGIPVVSSITKCNYLLTHIPVHPSELVNFAGNIHGHLHSGAKIKGNYFNVCIDVIGYNPIPFNRKFSGISKKTHKYVNKPKQKRKYG